MLTMDRRDVIYSAAALSTTAVSAFPSFVAAASNPPTRMRVGVIGCGNVSASYLPHLRASPHAELVSACDIIPARAEALSKAFNIPHVYPQIESMLAGAEFDLLVHLTDMQEHERLNRAALASGKHVWSEKPLANSFEAAQSLLALAEKNERWIRSVPVVVASPAFAFIAEALASRKLGRVVAAHAQYGHNGPNWAAFVHQQGGGSLLDLAVYNITTLTGLLGPARSVTAMTSVVTPTRKSERVGEIQVVADDNAMLLMNHGDGVISHVQSGFHYFHPHDDKSGEETRETLSIIGSEGTMGLVGYDWDPRAVDLATLEAPSTRRHVIEPSGFCWQMGASLAAESLFTGRSLLITPEHAVHVLEVIGAATQSQEGGRLIELQSRFEYSIGA